MIRKGSIIRLRPEYEEQYIILHKHTFPGVLSQIRRSNIRNYSIFLLDGILFSYYEYIGDDYDNDMKTIADETTKEWWKLTDPMQEPLPSRKEEEWWASMEKISVIEENERPSSGAKRYAWTAELQCGLENIIRAHFSTLEGQCAPYYKQHNFQNQVIYFTARNLYMYREYIGENYLKDYQNFLNIPEVKKWNERLEKIMTTSWHEMKEVFHTD
jgi:L-rhamnose mutarotase